MTYKALIAIAGMLALSGCVVPYDDDDRRGHNDRGYDERGSMRNDDHDRDRNHHDDQRDEHRDHD